jgi:hypothetical protein
MQLKKPIGDGFWRGIDLLVMERSIPDDVQRRRA